MKKNSRLKTITNILLAITITVAVCIACAGCACDPYEIRIWYLDRSTISPFLDFYEAVCADDATLEFYKDGTFLFRDFGTEREGTYTYTKGSKESNVKLYFVDGQSAEGSLSKDTFGEVRYYGHFTIDGVSYDFSDDYRYSYIRAEKREDVVNAMKDIINIDGKGTSDAYRFDFYSGHVAVQDSDFVFIYDCDEYEPAVLSASHNVIYTSYIDSEFLPRTTELREGTATVRQEIWSTVDGTEYTVYWIWYYDKPNESLDEN